MTRSKTPALRKTKAGFALVIALSLMAFVLVLILSMTLLVQVESRASATAKAQLQARENAHLALLIAISELQQHAGFDQRDNCQRKSWETTISYPVARFWTGM